jgi:hypothetical protein
MHRAKKAPGAEAGAFQGDIHEETSRDQGALDAPYPKAQMTQGVDRDRTLRVDHLSPQTLHVGRGTE